MSSLIIVYIIRHFSYNMFMFIEIVSRDIDLMPQGFTRRIIGEKNKHLTTTEMRNQKAEQENALKKKNPLWAQTIPWWDTTLILSLTKRGNEEGSSS